MHTHEPAAAAAAATGGGEDILAENALCETLFVRDDHFKVFMDLAKGLLEDGRHAEARGLVARAVALCEKRSRWGRAVVEARARSVGQRAVHVCVSDRGGGGGRGETWCRCTSGALGCS
jgi:hypothetical protein